MTGCRSVLGAPRLLALLALAFAIAATTTSASAAQPAPPPRGGAAWMPYWQMNAALTSVTGPARPALSTVSPFWYDARSCGSIAGHRGAGSPLVVGALRQANLTIIPTVTASGLDPKRARQCFGSDVRRAAHVARILTLVDTNGYDGIDLDYEGFVFKATDAQGRLIAPGFAQMVSELCSALQARGRTCTVTVPAPSPTRNNGIDYAQIGASAGQVRIMAYDNHWSGGPPGPIAGQTWRARVMTDTERFIARDRLLLGVPMYGRVWVPGAKAQVLTGNRARALARKHRARVSYDARQREYTFRYKRRGRTRTAWFSGTQAVADATAYAERRGWAGAAYWAAGSEEPGTWFSVLSVR